MSKLPLERTDAPGIYRRGSRYVVVYRVEGRQRKQHASTLAEARAIKLQRGLRDHDPLPRAPAAIEREQRWAA